MTNGRREHSKLADRGVTTAPADIWFAQRATLDAAVRNERDHDWTGLKAEIADKKESYLRNKLRTPRWALADVQEGLGDEEPDVLAGLSGSHGSAEGEIFLLSGPEDFAAFPNRAVLVARTTSPAWTPLFYSASAVVTESGGPLSHGAVTARELGKPAVIAVRNVLSILKSGDRVRVDGAAGKVYRLG